MFEELSTIVLTRAVPEQGLEAGDLGAVVHVYPDGEHVEVEFVTGAGKTIAVLTLGRSDVRAMKDAEILHVRAIPASAA